MKIAQIKSLIDSDRFRFMPPSYNTLRKSRQKGQIISNKAGFIRFAHLDTKVTVIYELMVIPDFRRNGWGRLLFYKLLCDAIETRQQLLSFKVQRENEDAAIFLRRLGFTRIAAEIYNYMLIDTWQYKIQIPLLFYCADGGRNRYGKIAKKQGWMLGLRSDAPGVQNHVHFIENHFRKYEYKAHLARTKYHKPLLGTVKDVYEEQDVEKMLEQIEEISEYCGRVLVIPKAFFHARLKENVWFGYSVPSAYGATYIDTSFFGDRPTHLLGGSPDAQAALARILNVVSLNSDYALVVSKFGHSVYQGVGSGIPVVEGCYPAFEVSMKKQRQYWRKEFDTSDLPLLAK